MFVRDDGDGETHDGKLLVVPSAVDGVDVAAQSIVSIIKVGYDKVESFDRGLTDRINLVWPTHKHKVVAAHVADEPFRSRQFSYDRRENAARDYKDFVASAIAVTVVEGLEIVDIQIGQGEGLPTFDSSRGLEQDRGISREACEGIGIQRSGQATQTQTHPLHHIFRMVGNRDVVVDPERAPVDIIQANVPDEDNEREPTEKGIALQVSREGFDRPSSRAF